MNMEVLAHRPRGLDARAEAVPVHAALPGQAVRVGGPARVRQPGLEAAAAPRRWRAPPPLRRRLGRPTGRLARETYMPIVFR